jgi:CheY-specific phosphatase CheX
VSLFIPPPLEKHHAENAEDLHGDGIVFQITAPVKVAGNEMKQSNPQPNHKQ